MRRRNGETTQTKAQLFTKTPLAACPYIGIMKDRRLIKGLRCVAHAVDPSLEKQADPFSHLQSIAAACGVALGDDGLLLDQDPRASRPGLQMQVYSSVMLLACTCSLHLLKLCGDCLHSSTVPTCRTWLCRPLASVDCFGAWHLD